MIEIILTVGLTAAGGILAVIAWFMRRLVADLDENRKMLTQVAVDVAVISARNEETESRLDSHSHRLRDLERK